MQDGGLPGGEVDLGLSDRIELVEVVLHSSRAGTTRHPIYAEIGTNLDVGGHSYKDTARATGRGLQHMCISAASRVGVPGSPQP